MKNLLFLNYTFVSLINLASDLEPPTLGTKNLAEPDKISNLDFVVCTFNTVK